MEGDRRVEGYEGCWNIIFGVRVCEVFGVERLCVCRVVIFEGDFGSEEFGNWFVVIWDCYVECWCVCFEILDGEDGFWFLIYGGRFMKGYCGFMWI